jgi:hypothetical protein
LTMEHRRRTGMLIVEHGTMGLLTMEQSRWVVEPYGVTTSTQTASRRGCSCPVTQTGATVRQRGGNIRCLCNSTRLALCGRSTRRLSFGQQGTYVLRHSPLTH